jgi:hypothetical protein
MPQQPLRGGSIKTAACFSIKLIIELLDCWSILPGLQAGTDTAYSFHEAVGSILGNELPNAGKYSRAFINVASSHVGCTKIQFGHRDVDISIKGTGRVGKVEFQRVTDDLDRVGCPSELK